MVVDAPSERGSAPVETTFAIVIAIFLALGAIQVVLTLYARNVVAASAHEGARAAVERGRDPSEAAGVAQRAVEAAAGALVDDLKVQVRTSERGELSVVQVHATGRLRAAGVVPLPLPVDVTATATREAEVP